MPTNEESPMTAIAGRDRLRRYAEGAKLLGLIKAAGRAGVLAHLRSPSSADDVVAALPHLDPVVLKRVLTVLTDADVLLLDGQMYSMAADVAALVNDVIGIDLEALVVEAELEARRAGEVFAEPAYPVGTDALALAEVSGGRPVPAMVGLLAMVYDAIPAFRDRLAEGGPFLDAGAGIGGNLLATVSAFPGLHATGVEADPAVAEQLRSRTDAAGMGERVTVLQGDIRALDLEAGTFATTYWAQTFFAPETRAASLQAVVRAMRSGGVLVVQELFPAPAPGDVSGQLDQLIMTSWGMAYGESLEDIRAELEAAGLQCHEPVATPLGRLLTASKP